MGLKVRRHPLYRPNVVVAVVKAISLGHAPLLFALFESLAVSPEEFLDFSVGLLGIPKILNEFRGCLTSRDGIL